ISGFKKYSRTSQVFWYNSMCWRCNAIVIISWQSGNWPIGIPLEICRKVVGSIIVVAGLYGFCGEKMETDEEDIEKVTKVR
ncbi:hypothetical protein HAX54_044849, partial [Datura stramonium]|nr:hypothetical protein [Datura stramonium]